MKNPSSVAAGEGLSFLHDKVYIFGQTILEHHKFKRTLNHHKAFHFVISSLSGFRRTLVETSSKPNAHFAMIILLLFLLFCLLLGKYMLPLLIHNS